MTDDGQVSASAAEFYDEFFVPALFVDWGPRIVEAARVVPGMRVVDVACGTGVATLAASAAAEPGGSVVGVDSNGGMLAVARRKSSSVEWVEAPAESLPFDDESFDAVLSQFGLMFFTDRIGALREMLRVLRPGGRLAVAVWASLDRAPGYAATTALLSRLFGDDVADRLRAPYALGDEQALRSLFREAGVSEPHVTPEPGSARFSSIRQWMECDVFGWTLADVLDDAQFERLVEDAQVALARFELDGGRVEFAHPALFVTAQKPA